MSSMCYPETLQAEMDEYCDRASRPRISISPGREADALRAVMSHRPEHDPQAASLRRLVIARLSYLCGRCAA